MALTLDSFNQCLDAALVNPSFARHDSMNGLDQQLWSAMLEENTADSKAQRADRVGVVHAGRHDEDPASEASLARSPG